MKRGKTIVLFQKSQTRADAFPEVARQSPRAWTDFQYMIICLNSHHVDYASYRGFIAEEMLAQTFFG